MSVPAIKKIKLSNITVDKNMRDYSQDPAFKASAERAAAFLKKHGLPERFKKKK